MKKIVLVLLLCFMVCSFLTGCGSNRHVKIISYQSEEAVEREVNKWIDENNVDVVDIQITSRNYDYVVMIVYKGKVIE